MNKELLIIKEKPKVPTNWNYEKRKNVCVFKKKYTWRNC